MSAGISESGSLRRRIVWWCYWVAAIVAPLLAAATFAGWFPKDLVGPGRILAALITVASLILKGISDGMAKKREDTLAQARAAEERRISVILSDLAETLGSTNVAGDSRVRERSCVEAAEIVVGKLLAPKASEVRSCFYRLQWKEEPVLPGEDPDQNAFLQLVGTARGRGVDKPRDEFTFDDEGGEGDETLRHILDNRPAYSSNTYPQLTGKSYGSFVSVPVHREGEIIGMITADSPDVGALDLQCEHLLRTVGAFAALGLDTDALTVGRGIGAGQGALDPDEHFPLRDLLGGWIREDDDDDNR